MAYKPWYDRSYATPAIQKAQAVSPREERSELDAIRKAALGKLLSYGIKSGLGAAGFGPLASIAFNKGGAVYKQGGGGIDYAALAAEANALIDQQQLADHNALRQQHASNPGLFGNVFAAQPAAAPQVNTGRQGVLIPGVQQTANQREDRGNYQQQARGNLNYLNEQAAANQAIKDKAANYKFFNKGGSVHTKGHEEHLTPGHFKADYKAVGGMMKQSGYTHGGKVGPLASVKYKKSNGDQSHEHEMKYHNPLQKKGE